MRALISAVMIALCLAAPVRAQDASEADKTEIRRVITAQMDAFKRNDGEGALAYAAPEMRKRFGDGPAFLAMVRENYPAVYRPRSVAFGSAAPGGGTTVQHVELVGPDGQAAIAIYEMVRTANGQWRIAGCSVFRSQAVET